MKYTAEKLCEEGYWMARVYDEATNEVIEEAFSFDTETGEAELRFPATETTPERVITRKGGMRFELGEKMTLAKYTQLHGSAKA